MLTETRSRATTENETLGEIESPVSGETIRSSGYTVRVSAFAAVRRVDLSLNEGPWEICRALSDTEWYYEWSGYKPGFHQAVARLTAFDGSVHVTPPQRFRVDI